MRGTGRVGLACARPQPACPPGSQVRGPEALRAFSQHLVHPYSAAGGGGDVDSDVAGLSPEDLRLQAAQLRARLALVEARLQQLGVGEA